MWVKVAFYSLKVSIILPMTADFSFQQFNIQQDRCAMKVGTDGVLLGAWAPGGPRVLDIGTGTGVVALMMAQRFPMARVYGVEIDAAAAAQARENVVASPFASRVSVVLSSFQDYVPTAPFDAIVSNPPFFLSSMKSDDTSRSLARHSDTLFFKAFFRFAKTWLSPAGMVSLIIPASAFEAIASEAYLLGFLLSSRVWIRSTPAKPIERCLVSFALQRRAEPILQEEYLTDEHGLRSAWYEKITQEFYLH